MSRAPNCTIHACDCCTSPVAKQTQFFITLSKILNRTSPTQINSKAIMWPRNMLELLIIQGVHSITFHVPSFTLISMLLLHVQLHNSTSHSLYKLYSLQLYCTYSNYTQAAATCSAAKQHSTAHLLYKLYSLQLYCTYSNYTQAAVTFSAAQQQSTFRVQILYSLQQNRTYSNYTQAAATCSAAQQHITFTVQILYSLSWTVLTALTHKLLLHVQLHNNTSHSL
jgi:hypothetical protein